MRIQYASDLHLELPANEQLLLERPLVPCGDVLVLAGDIAYLDDSYTEHPFWDWASEHYQQVIVALGNHEFYNRYDLATMKDGMKGKIRHNVFWYYNRVVHIDDIDFIVSTMWSHIKDEINSDMFIEKSTIVLTDGNSLKYNLSVRIYLLIFALDTHCFSTIR